MNVRQSVMTSANRWGRSSLLRLASDGMRRRAPKWIWKCQELAVTLLHTAAVVADREPRVATRNR